MTSQTRAFSGTGRMLFGTPRRRSTHQRRLRRLTTPAAAATKSPPNISLNRFEFMRNAEIADAMSELATLYELDGAIRYRVLAYREAARVIRQSPVSVEELARAGRATELPGIGKTLEQKIVALLDDGEIPSAAKLKRKFPPSLIEVTMVPGVGAKTARRLYDELGVSSLEDLRVAAEQERIRQIKGLGPKVEENVLASLGKLTDRRPV